MIFEKEGATFELRREVRLERSGRSRLAFYLGSYGFFGSARRALFQISRRSLALGLKVPAFCLRLAPKPSA